MTIIDAGTPDAGVADAGVADAGIRDAGAEVDAGMLPEDAGSMADAGFTEPDAGESIADAGAGEGVAGGCGCTGAPGSTSFLLLGALFALNARRRRSRN